MANICEGVLKVRGSRECIERFMREAFEAVSEHDDYRVSSGADFFQIQAKHGLYVKGTDRNVIRGGDIFLPFEAKKDRHSCPIGLLSVAWGIDKEHYARLSETYQVDLKVFLFEKGMQENHDFEVQGGHIVRDEIISYQDYNWDCVQPLYGG